MTLAVPGTNEPFSTAVVNANFEAIDTEVGTTRTALVAGVAGTASVASRVTTLEAGAGRGTGANLIATTLTNLNTAAATASPGDLGVCTTLPTGIARHLWISQATLFKAIGPMTAATKANMDSYVLLVVAQASLQFVPGTLWTDQATGFIYEFTSTAGVYVPLPTSTRVQTDTTNALVQTVRKVGKGKIAGAVALSVSEAVTFDTTQPFTTRPTITAISIGSSATGAYNDASLSATSAYAAISGLSATGFTVTLIAAVNLSAANDYYYSWQAEGAI